MSFSKQAFSIEERDKLKKRIKELEQEVERLKNTKLKIPKKETNQLEDILC